MRTGSRGSCKRSNIKSEIAQGLVCDQKGLSYMTAVSEIFPGISIIDSDTHWSEPPDLWTSLAPAKYKDLDVAPC